MASLFRRRQILIVFYWEGQERNNLRHNQDDKPSEKHKWKQKRKCVSLEKQSEAVKKRISVKNGMRLDTGHLKT
jgi:hypothetical protein